MRLSFYDHRETPGLGGEVDNVKWQSSWKGKKLFDAKDQFALTVIKGSVIPDNARESYQVDGLSGATLTSDGVTKMFHFWMGEHGFEKFMNKVRAGETL
jgi:Na+-transporting NADH:ubiquinone oxidoreductase subunit C